MARLLLAASCFVLGCSGLPPRVFRASQVLQLTERVHNNRSSRFRSRIPGGMNFGWFRPAAQPAMRREEPEPCGPVSSAPYEEWEGAGHDMQQMWQSKLPEAAIHIEDLESVCQFHGGDAATVLTVVSAMEAAKCVSDEATHGQDYVALHDETISKVAEFATPQALPGGGSARKYVAAWPSKRTCTESDRCPVVVSLHGHGEHTSPDLLQAWGYLNYLHHDAKCHAALGSALLFPQLVEDESWVKDGATCVEHFVIPLLNHVERTTSSIDMERVGLIGYSEGAIGALQGAMLFPDVFAVVASGSPVLPTANWENVQITTKRSAKPSKLKLVVVGFGETDPMGDMPLSLERAVDMVTANGGLGDGIFRIRLYASMNHISTFEGLLNNWGKLHQILWEGDFDGVEF